MHRHAAWGWAPNCWIRQWLLHARRGCSRIWLVNNRDRDSYLRGFYARQGWQEQPQAARFVLPCDLHLLLMTTYLLALDQGTSSSRSIVFDAQGRIVASAQQELPQIYPAPAG